MFDISNNGIITISRGDSFSLNVLVNLGTNLNPIPYSLKEGDKLYFALMEPNQPFEHALIRKEATIEDKIEDDLIRFGFSSEMTEFLMPGNYYYMVKLVRPIYGESGEEISLQVDTIISKTKFVIID